MTKYWLDHFQRTIGTPKTVVEAVDQLMMILDNEQKKAIAIIREEDLFDLHLGLGMAIRNVFKLHESGSKLLASCGVKHPDDASGLIIAKLWLALRPDERNILSPRDNV